MNSFYYIRLAVTNIKNNSKTYIPYVISAIGMVIMFYNLNFVANAKDIGNNSESLRMVLKLGMFVVGLFSVFFMLYTNSFLIKRRKKEFGLFNILGMEKKHIARIMLFETLIIGLGCIITGILAGIILSKLIILLLYKLIAYKVRFGFEIPAMAVLVTVILFSLIFLMTLIYNILQVHLAKPIELLKSSNVGEKEPKTKWFSALAGSLSLGFAYYIALSTKSPLAAMNIFFIAVILVIIGTDLLFKAGSIAILKMLRKNNRFYYKARHFISISGMIYRMKRNATGLANICILSTMVIVMLSTTVSLYVGIEDVIRNRYPRNINVSSTNTSYSQAEALDEIIEEQLALYNIEAKNVLRYCFTDYVANQNGDSFKYTDSRDSLDSSLTLLTFMSLDEYKRQTGEDISLTEDEALLYSIKGNITGDRIDLNGYKLRIKEHLDSFFIENEMAIVVSKSYVIVVKDTETLKEIDKALSAKQDKKFKLSYYYGFDTDADSAKQIELTEALEDKIAELEMDYYVDGAERSRDFIFTLYGGLLYLGIFLGLLFIMETVLIIYYKQITEGYDDKERFEIMQKVGMSGPEVKKVVRSQVLAVFFLPLIMAIIHLAFAFKVITKLLALLNLTNIPLFAACTLITVIVFALFYIMVYAVTAKSYYNIVKK